MASKIVRSERFIQNTKEVTDFAKKHGLQVKPFNNGYQLRLGGVIDIYPVNKRWHYLSTGQRGDYTNISELDMAIFATDFNNRYSPVHDEPSYDTEAIVEMIVGNDNNKRRRWWQIWR